LIKHLGICLVLALAFASPARLAAQGDRPSEPHRPLALTEALSLSGIQGRFEHLDFDHQNQLLVSALGNNTVEVIDVSARTLRHTITGIPNPEGVVYAPETKKLFVASSKGKLYIYDGASFALVKEIDFHGDVDNLRYDAANRRVYVGDGDDETGAIGTVDASTSEHLQEEYKLGSHPESFQLDSAGPNIYVNLPELRQIAAINRSTPAITRWPLRLEHNFPMALDETDHRLFVATHEPARLAVFGATSGHLVASLPCIQDADDLYYDLGRKRIYAPGARGTSACINRRMLTTMSF
jgi:DNA-binding beta-propeller fold protein YncE